MTCARLLGLALLAAGGQGGPTATVVVRTPGAPPGDSLAVVRAVTQVLDEAKIEVVDHAPGAKSRPGTRGARYIVEVTAKVMQGRALVDLRAIDAGTRELVDRVAIRAATPAIPDSAAAAARRIARKLTSRKASPDDQVRPVFSSFCLPVFPTA